jgi:hypothetical protein
MKKTLVLKYLQTTRNSQEASELLSRKESHEEKQIDIQRDLESSKGDIISTSISNSFTFTVASLPTQTTLNQQQQQQQLQQQPHQKQAPPSLITYHKLLSAILPPPEVVVEDIDIVR